MSPNQRGSRRINVTLDLQLLHAKGGRVAGRTVDVGPGGMCVTTNRPLSVDEVLRFDLELHDRHVNGNARVLRMHRPNVYALRFEDIDEGDRRVLSEALGQAA